MKHKTFSTNVKGEWKLAVNWDFCEGKWLWNEAKDKLLLEFGDWRKREFPVKDCIIYSIHWRYWTGRDIEAGAKLYLDVICE